jgi:hypothetical protein
LFDVDTLVHSGTIVNEWIYLLYHADQNLEYLDPGEMDLKPLSAGPDGTVETVFGTFARSLGGGVKFLK